MKLELDRIWEHDIRGLLETAGAIEKGHFVGKSGKHLDTYINKDILGVDPEILERLAYELAHRLDDRLGLASGKKDVGVDVILGSPMGAITLASRVAFHVGRILAEYGKPTVIRSLYAEKNPDGELYLRSTLARFISSGVNVITIEDVLTTGRTANEMLQLIKQLGGKPIAVGAIGNRGGVTKKDLGEVEVVPLLNLNLNSFPASECPLCKSGVPIRKDLGHGAEFLAAQTPSTEGK